MVGPWNSDTRRVSRAGGERAVRRREKQRQQQVFLDRLVVRIHLQRLLEFKQGCVHVAAFCALALA